MKKVGILTFHRVANYGAVLQAYALTKTLQKYKCTAELIDYDNLHLRQHYRPLRLKDFKHPRLLLKNVLGLRKHIIRNCRFKLFRKNNLILSEKRYTQKNLPNGKEYDLVIVGSDQVWNLDCNGNDMHYFLDTIDSTVPCVSYAASMAQIDLDDSEKQFYKEHLIRFLCISVRESQAKDVLQPLTKKNIEISPDPIFLLTQDEWNEVVVTPQESDYIFLFLIFNNDDLIKVASEFSRKNNCKLIVINMDSIKYEHRYGTIFPVSPDKWLGYIKNAKYVITDSFHGTAFSVVFQKNFTSIVKADAGKNSRIKSLLKELNLEDRATSELEDKIPTEIDYSKVEPLLENYRNRGLEYLKEVISSIKEK